MCWYMDSKAIVALEGHSSRRAEAYMSFLNQRPGGLNSLRVDRRPIHLMAFLVHNSGHRLERPYHFSSGNVTLLTWKPASNSKSVKSDESRWLKCRMEVVGLDNWVRWNYANSLTTFDELSSVHLVTPHSRHLSVSVELFVRNVGRLEPWIGIRTPGSTRRLVLAYFPGSLRILWQSFCARESGPGGLLRRGSRI